MKTKVCNRCGKELEAGTRKSVCNDCRRVKNVCENCGKEFTTEYLPRKFCSKACGYTSKARASQVVVQDRPFTKNTPHCIVAWTINGDDVDEIAFQLARSPQAIREHMKEMVSNGAWKREWLIIKRHKKRQDSMKEANNYNQKKIR